VLREEADGNLFKSESEFRRLEREVNDLDWRRGEEIDLLAPEPSLEWRSWTREEAGEGAERGRASVS
jgi:hypothetical protein